MNNDTAFSISCHMKTYLTILLATSLVTSATYAQDKISQARALRAQLVHQHYRKAEFAWKNGNVEEAKKSLNTALKMDPSHAPSYALALQIKGSGAKIASDDRKRMFSTTILPVVDFNTLEFKEALDILTKLIEKQSDGKFNPNFIVQDPSKKLAGKEVTFNLKNVPASVVLDYLLNSVHAGATFDKHATVIRPKQ